MYQVFGSAPLADEERQLDLNVRAVLRLTHAAGPGDDRARQRPDRQRVLGRRLRAARRRTPRTRRSKAWVTMFSEALSVQLARQRRDRDRGLPGLHPHRVPRARRGRHVARARTGCGSTAEDVVREGLADAFAGKPVSVPTRQYRRLVLLAAGAAAGAAPDHGAAAASELTGLGDRGRRDLLELIKELAVVHGRVTLSSGRRPTTTSTCAASPCTARPRRSSAGCCAS